MTDERKIEMLTDLFRRCIEINGLEAHKHSDNNRPNMFFRYYGHCSTIDIDCHINGWVSGGEYDKFANFLRAEYLDENIYNEIVEKLEKIRNHKSEIALDTDCLNLHKIQCLNVGEMFMLKTPIDTVMTGEVVLSEKGTKQYYFRKFNAHGEKQIAFAGLKNYMQKLSDLKG